MIMHESQPDPPEPEDREQYDEFNEPDADEPPDVPASYPQTVAAFFDAAGITQPE